MFKSTLNLFGKTRLLESQIDEFLNHISEGGIYFEMGLNSYLDEDKISELCEEKCQALRRLEDRCSELRRSISLELYQDMLIPEFRSDVLSLLQDLHYLIDVFEDNFQDLMIERPFIPNFAKSDFRELTKMVVKCVEMVITATRDYFRTPITVRDSVHKINLYESEADNIALRLKQKIFDSDLPLENKIQLRYVVDVIDEIADSAEEVSDWLAIYAIKRAL